jgi:hypothetical protein
MIERMEPMTRIELVTSSLPIVRSIESKTLIRLSAAVLTLLSPAESIKLQFDLGNRGLIEVRICRSGFD